MKCNRLKIFFIPYIEGCLDAERARRVEEHVSSCASCAAEIEELRQTVGVLRSANVPAMEPASDMRSRVIARIQPEPSKQSWIGFRLRTYAAVGTALIILGIAIINIAPKVGERGYLPNNLPRSYYESHGLEAPPAAVDATEPPAMQDTATKTEPSSKQAAGKLKEPTPQSTPRAPKSARVAETSGKSAAGGGASNQVQSPSPAVGEVQKDASFSYEEHEFMAKARRDEEGLSIQAERSTVPSGPAGLPPSMAAEGMARDTRNVAAVKSATPSEDKAGADILVLEKKLQEYPKSKSVMFSLLEAYRQAGRVQDEYAIAERLTKLEPENAGFWFILGQASEKAGKPRMASSAYRRAEKEGLSGPDLELARSRMQSLDER